MILLCIKSWSR